MEWHTLFRALRNAANGSQLRLTGALTRNNNRPSLETAGPGNSTGLEHGERSPAAIQKTLHRACDASRGHGGGSPMRGRSGARASRATGRTGCRATVSRGLPRRANAVSVGRTLGELTLGELTRGCRKDYPTGPSSLPRSYHPIADLALAHAWPHRTRSLPSGLTILCITPGSCPL